MVHLVAFLQATQDGDGVFLAGLVDLHLLEAALECGVLLDVLAILVKRGGTDTVQLATRQRRLEHVAGIHRAFGLARADHGVQLVDEQDDLAFFLCQLLQHRLEALLEFAAELGPRQQRAHVEGQHALVLEAFRHLAIDDTAGQPLDDGGLADAGLTDQHRVVLGATLQHLDRAANFLVTPDHRVELAIPRTLGQIQRVLVERLAIVLGIGIAHGFATAQCIDGGGQSGLLDARGGEQLAQITAQLQRGQQRELGGDELIAALLRFTIGQIQKLAEGLRGRDIAVELGHGGQVIQLALEATHQAGGIAARLVDQRLEAAIAVFQQCQQQVLRVNFIVTSPDGERLGIRQSVLQLAGEFVDAHGAFS